MTTLERMQQRVERERRARKEAERLGEEKTRELFLANQRLTALTDQLEEAVRQRTGELESTLAKTEALYRASRSLIGAESVASVLQSVVDNVAEAIGADRVQLIGIQREAGEIVYSVKGGPGAALLQDMDFDGLMQGLSGWAIREQKPAISPKGSVDERESNEVQAMRRQTAGGSVVVIPLYHRGTILGTLTAVNRPQQPDFSSDDIELLGAMANQAAIAVSNAQLFEEMREARHAAETANRAKSRFLASMSHELRTPLNGILGYAQILRRDGSLPQKVHNAAKVIQGSGDHLLTLINDILDISKIEAEKMELVAHEFHLRGFLDTIAGIIGMQARDKNIAFHYKLHANVPQAVRSDELRLRQVLLNILGNAVKYTQAGSVSFTVGYHHDAVRFVIEDTGVGIQESNLQDIFEPFRQIEDRRVQVEGTGLGLAICSRLLKMMESELKVESKPQVGSRFWFDLKLPTAQMIAPVPESERSEVVGYEGAVRTILIADDREANRTLLHDLLHPLGFQLLEAVNGKIAFETALAQRPELILMDLVMPVMDGFEATDLLRNAGGDYRPSIVAVSASVFDITREDCIKAGLNDYVVKPVDLEQLLVVIETQLGLQWKLANQRTDQDVEMSVVAQEERAIKPPPASILQQFLALAIIGDVNGIQSSMTAMSEQLAPFATFRDAVETLTEDFRLDELQRMIEHCLNEQEHS